MPQRLVKDLFEWADSVPNPRGTLKPVEQGTLPRRMMEGAGQHLESARSNLIEVMSNKAKEQPWQEKSWNAYRRLQLIATDIDIGDWQEPNSQAEIEHSELDLSSDEENLAMEIDPLVLNEHETDVEVDDGEWIDVEHEHLADDQWEQELEEEPSLMNRRAPDQLANLSRDDFMALIASLRQQVPQEDFGEEGEAFALRLIAQWEQQRLATVKA